MHDWTIFIKYKRKCYSDCFANFFGTKQSPSKEEKRHPFPEVTSVVIPFRFWSNEAGAFSYLDWNYNLLTLLLVSKTKVIQIWLNTELLLVSSFLKQHNDEAAVFQSFRDMNELIQETVESKRRLWKVSKRGCRAGTQSSACSSPRCRVKDKCSWIWRNEYQGNHRNQSEN